MGLRACGKRCPPQLAALKAHGFDAARQGQGAAFFARQRMIV
jgi:hypothetical protein